jgi:cyclopropane fatty-acyl-phospholipid synthase-like methyltransferase
MKPYSESCDQNRDAILQIITPLFEDRKNVLEIGSGTGQHAVYFAKKMPHLVWHTSDRTENHAGILAWIHEAMLDNVREPMALDVSQEEWPATEIDAVFSANTVHIMSWPEVKIFIESMGKQLPKNGLFVLYGPFNYGGNFTSESNARFDQWLKQRDPLSGVRDFEALNKLAQQVGMELENDYDMPANNRILCWRKVSLTLK